VGLIDRFQNIFKRNAPAPTAATVTAVTPPYRPSATARLMSEETDRRTLVRECQAMYRNDTRAREILQAVARDATRGGFELVVEGPRSVEAKAIATDMLERVDFWKWIEPWVRLVLRDGDAFLELVADGAGDLVEVSRKPTLEMHRLSDEFDHFGNPAKAFAWSDALWGGWTVEGTPPPGSVTFAEWQMIHARWDHDGDGRYGSPMFAAARTSFKRMSEGELDIAIRRKTRAGMKYVHSLKDASQADIEAYRLRNQAALDEPFAAVADFFSSKETSITAVQGDANLSEIEDVLHHMRTWWLASPKPMGLMGFGQDLNRDVLDEQQREYDLAKEAISRWITEEIVAPLIERQWLLKGILPEGLTWTAEWSSTQPLTAVGLADMGKAVAALKMTGLLTNETLLRLISRFLPDFDADAEIEALADERPDEIGRMASQVAPDDLLNDEESDDVGDSNRGLA
jgi:hypothetical protein